jgi:hypothetical protein
MLTIKEISETYFYKNESDAKEHDPKKAIGYAKTANGIYVTGWGVQTEFKRIDSKEIK